MVNGNFNQQHYEIDSIQYNQVPLDLCEPLGGDRIGSACYHMRDVFLMSLVLMAGTFILAYFFKWMRNSRYGPTRVKHKAQ